MSAIRWDVEHIRQMQIDLHRLAEPFVRLKCDILAVAQPKLMCFSDGRCETTYSPEVKRQLAEVDDLWKAARDSYMADCELFGRRLR